MKILRAALAAGLAAALFPPSPKAADAAPTPVEVLEQYMFFLDSRAPSQDQFRRTVVALGDCSPDGFEVAKAADASSLSIACRVHDEETGRARLEHPNPGRVTASLSFDAPSVAAFNAAFARYGYRVDISALTERQVRTTVRIMANAYTGAVSRRAVPVRERA